tara:strand:- start:337 stop:723 length:387 start_codon:yes stop_codon:yes gene_type:complete
MMKNKLYRHYAELEDVGGEEGNVHMNLINSDLNIIKEINISYFSNNKNNEYKDEKVSFFELKNKLLNQEDFIEKVFLIDIVEDDFGIRLSGGEMWISSYDKKKSDLIYTILTSVKKSLVFGKLPKIKH